MCLQVWFKFDWMETGQAMMLVVLGLQLFPVWMGEVDSDETGDDGEGASCLGGGPVYQVILPSVIRCGWLPFNL